MRCETSEIDLETAINRIKNGDIDLQPDFQRGEVWSQKKKKTLIDTIIRKWRIPPIHVVRNTTTAIEEVLDGQQRLVAIRDFINGDFPIDGYIEPSDPQIENLHGMRYQQLAPEIRRSINQYPITFVRLTEYNPSEPAELFYRLNQPASLTSAEKRNAYIGKTRDQVKDLVKLLEQSGGNKDSIGFSNVRLAYDDVISKFVFAVETGTLKRKITLNDLSERYRANKEFSDKTLELCEDTIVKLTEALCIIADSETRVHLNKATMFSWLIFLRNDNELSSHESAQLIHAFETARKRIKGGAKPSNDNDVETSLRRAEEVYPYFEVMLTLFNQKASMGSTDALSIIHRDIIINLFFCMLFDQDSELLRQVTPLFAEYQNFNLVLDRIVEQYSWGESF